MLGPVKVHFTWAGPTGTWVGAACRATGWVPWVTVPRCCFSARPCVVGEWSPWSGCADQCKPAARVRRRLVQQEPLNGGAPCPALEERAGCLEYWTRQGQDCGHAFGKDGGLHGAAFVVFVDFPLLGPTKDQVRSGESSARCSEWDGLVCREKI